jgi:competence protein ComEA
VSEQLERYRWLVVGLLAVPLLVGIGFLVRDRTGDPQELKISTGEVPIADVRAYVTGAVQHPGVYPLHDGDRWIDAVTAAGGPTAEADLTAINLSRRVHDEDQVTVPKLGQSAAVAGANQGPLLNINTAGETDLMDLPGIGEVRAATIIDSRSTEGPFGSVDDLVARKLIPQSVLDDIVGMITAP